MQSTFLHDSMQTFWNTVPMTPLLLPFYIHSDVKYPGIYFLGIYQGIYFSMNSIHIKYLYKDIV